jgi:phosphatidylserine/phosphatidylglycerophosphate/cardiolipin synthase-like enzyme
MSSSIRIRTLTDGGQQPLEVAREVADFFGAARQSLDLAQYDFHLAGKTRELVGGAIRAAHERGVAVRIIYNVDHANPIPVPPPPEPDVELIASLGVPAKAIAGVPDLMHHKYVVRDGATVWTGSANWTDESWTRQENVLVTVDSEDLARSYTLDFDDPGRTGRSRGRAGSSRGRCTSTRCGSSPGSPPATARSCRTESRSGSRGRSACASARR